MSKKRFIWQRRLSAGLSVLLCLSMLPVAALAEEPDSLACVVDLNQQWTME